MAVRPQRVAGARLIDGLPIEMWVAPAVMWALVVVFCIVAEKVRPW